VRTGLHRTQGIRTRVEGRRNRSKADLGERRLGTKPECRSSFIPASPGLSTVELESVRTETEDAGMVTASHQGMGAPTIRCS
jgi:hypothetical protein